MIIFWVERETASEQAWHTSQLTSCCSRMTLLQQREWLAKRINPVTFESSVPGQPRSPCDHTSGREVLPHQDSGSLAIFTAIRRASSLVAVGSGTLAANCAAWACDP
jgi:hypothetical protein